MTAKDTLAALGLTTETLTGGSLKVTSPIDGSASVGSGILCVLSEEQT